MRESGSLSRWEGVENPSPETPQRPRLPAPLPLADRLAIFKGTSRSRQSELSEPPVLWDIRIDHTNHPAAGGPVRGL